MNTFFELSNKEKLYLIFGENYKFITDGLLLGQDNMDFDFSQVELLSKETNSPFVFRFYGWRPYCLSLGYNQNDENVNKLALNNLGYDLVRRPTGGRAVFHSDEITYSCIVNLDIINQRLKENDFAEFDLTNQTATKYNHRDFYRDIHLILIEILSQINGLSDKLDYSKKDANFNNHYKDKTSMSCFSSSARYEITHQNKKIVGSAQRLFGNILLQHGSILLGREHLNIVNLLNLNDDEKSNHKTILENLSISISELCDREVEYNEVIKKVNDYFY